MEHTTSGEDTARTALMVLAENADPGHPATAAALHLLRLAGHSDVPGRGRDASNALTEIRTVLSRARTARELIDVRLEYARDENGELLRDTEDGTGFVRFEDPDTEDMRTVLDAVVLLLSRWDRTGRALRSTGL
ncbi:hypothetical protein [Streptomyces sp. NPDC001889]